MRTGLATHILAYWSSTSFSQKMVLIHHLLRQVEALHDTVDPVRRVKNPDIHQITTERRTCRGSNTLHGSSCPAFVSPLASIASVRGEKKKMVRAANDMRCVREQQSQRCVRENVLAAVINRRRCSGGQRSALGLMTWLIRLLGGQYHGRVMS